MPTYSNIELERLIQDNYGLIVSQALFFKPKTTEDREDLISLATCAFIKGAATFDIDKGKFSTYICSCIRNYITDHLRKNKGVHYVDLSKDLIAWPHDEFWELLPDNLTKNEKSVIMLKLDNYSKQEIGDIIGCSKKEVNNLFNKAKKKIKEANQ